MSGEPHRENKPAGCHSRLIACQGSVQLVAAVAASMHRDGVDRNSSRPRQSLVIHDLHAPPGQDVEFAQCLTHIAQGIGAWENVCYLSADDVRELTRIANRDGRSAAAEMLRKQLKIADLDELLLSQNQVLVNNLLGLAFPRSTKVCYGDGIGVNFSHQYFAPAPSRAFWKPLRRALARQITRVFRRRSNDGDLAELVYDEYALLLPNLFDQTVSHYAQIDQQLVRNVFDQIRDFVGPEVSRITATWSDALCKASQVIVLLTSNFSEALRMPRDREVEAYVDLVQAQCRTPDPIIVVKPHPRDSSEKIQRIRDLLQRRFTTVILLDDPLSFYLPFEVILLSSVLNDKSLLQRTTVICVSSACLALEYLYEMRCELGFGERVVREHFAKTWRELRLRHELDLENALRRIRLATSIRRAA